MRGTPVILSAFSDQPTLPPTQKRKTAPNSPNIIFFLQKLVLKCSLVKIKSLNIQRDV